MKKILIILSLIITLMLSGCVVTVESNYDTDNDNQNLTYVDAKFYEYFDDKECVALFFDYTNNSGESKCPGDGFVMGVRQNGELLGVLAVAEEVDGAIKPYTSVETGVTIRVAWLFVLRDKSTLSVVVSDGQEFTVDYEQIGN